MRSYLRLILALILIVFSVAIFSIIIKNFHAKKSEPAKNSWIKKGGVFGVYLWDGLFLKTNYASYGGGIALIPENYNPPRYHVKATIVDIDTNKKQEIEIFKDFPELSEWSVVPDQIHKKLIILVSGNEFICEKNEDDPYCKIQIYSFDPTSGSKKLLSTTASFTDEYSDKKRYYYSVRPLALDGKRDNLWFSASTNAYYDLPDSNENKVYSYNDKVFHVTLDSEEQFDAWSINIPGRISNSVPSYWGNSLAFYEKRKVAQLDAHGNLFVSVTTIDDTTNNPTEKTQLFEVKADQKDFDYNNLYDCVPFECPGDPEIASDERKNNLFIASNTWGGESISQIFKYRILTGKFDYLSKAPDGYGNTIRGMENYGDELFVSFNKGLGIFNLTNETWNLLTDKNGLIRSDSRDLVRLTDGRLCVTAGKLGMSCSRYPVAQVKF